jgi:hypothetical protein
VAGAPGVFIAAAMFVGLLALAAPSRHVVPAVHAGSPVGCDGWESSYCNSGRVAAHCCPKNAKCNYRDPPFVECGHGLCAVGHDIGRCPAPEPSLFTMEPNPMGADEASCKAKHGDWQLVCADKVVVAACIPPMPTNYSGPGYSPQFFACGKGQRLVSDEPAAGDRCSTHVLKASCYPTAAELGEAAKCLGKWEEVCLAGKVDKRCLPVSVPPLETFNWRATKFVKCDDGSCAVGDADDKARVCSRR